ncbi:hypothetical protein ABZU75_20335 [Streptosporangium sp. NPDC005286]|uniref:hypothetical protein n=1 Tax=Streptosporangium sp. NPDC005286 TaxID=3154463 RepID=UPI0033B3548A
MNTAPATITALDADRMPLSAAPASFAAFRALTARSLRACARTPSLLYSPLFMSAFFLIVYEAQLSTVASATTPGGRYIDVVLPLCLLTSPWSEQNLLPGALVTAGILAAGAVAARLALIRRTRTGV